MTWGKLIRLWSESCPAPQSNQVKLIIFNLEISLQELLLEEKFPVDVNELVIQVKQMEDGWFNIKLAYPNYTNSNSICHEILLNCLKRYNWTSYTSMVNVTTDLRKTIELLEMNPPRSTKITPVHVQTNKQIGK
ncbi:hypothetical protein A3Q56_06950 [Intoshia linei]|uniref:Uncharacterized protein n=1 Tax=Intoshia linei TaxID=1819745 RepID=A0A177ATL1_9BILA|nr:hypothetical protein A3Q56_06950 [Intoshia linei]